MANRVSEDEKKSLQTFNLAWDYYLDYITQATHTFLEMNNRQTN